jgi:hypothetical protein
MAVNFGVNYLAIVVAAVVAIVIGFVFFAPQTLGSRWTAYGIPAPPARPAPTTFVVGLLAALINAWVLAVLALNLRGSTVADGIMLGILVWLGFMATLTAAEGAFQGRPWAPWFINNAHHVIVQVLMGAIVTAWH